MQRRKKGSDDILIPPKRIHIVQGGSSASKTISILMYLITAAQHDGDRKTLRMTPTLTSIVSESVPHLKRGVIRDFTKIMQEHGYWKDDSWNKTDSIYTFETGSQIEFFSSDNGDKLRGARRDRLFLNEANNVTFDAFEQLEMRTNDFVFMDYNPTNEFWAMTEIMQEGKRTDWDFIILTYKDNEACPPNIIDSIEQRKNRKGWYSVYGLGLLGEVEGKIYSNWALIPEIPHEARLERYGVDFGYSVDPTAIVAIYYHNGGYIVDEVMHLKGMSNKHIADTLNGLDKAVTICDSAEPKSIDELKTFGVNALPAVKGKDSVRNGIQMIQDEKVSITSRSANLIHSYRNYLWMVDKNGKLVTPNVPEHTYSNLMDAMRYGMVSLIPNKRRPEYYPQFSTGPAKNPAL